MKKILTYFTLLASICLLTACHSHEFAPATCTQPETCTICGEIQGEALGHTFEKATCEAPETCSWCGETRGTALGHQWVDATCTMAKYCNRCSKSEGTPLEHVYSGGSCTEDAICENCGAVEAAPGHDYIPANCVEPATCRVCGATEGEPVGHKLKGLSCSQCDYSLASLSEMARVCSIQATCETDFSACLVDTENGHNPYDVIWDYGEEYQIYVDACDWSKVFDVSYYKKTFPMLAAQYHDDDALLLEHFQTVGIHEGRQGCKDFNVQAYYNNVDSKISKAFEKNWAAYYFYYMLSYEQEQNVNTVTADNGKKIYQQMKMVATCMQLQEHKHVNQYRAEVEAEDVKFDSEVAAFANLRAYINAHDGYKAHDWAEKDKDRLYSFLNKLGSWESFAENTVTHYSSRYYGDWAAKYRDSEKHYKAMVNEKYHYGGYSNAYYVKGLTSQFDVFVKSLDTAMHPKE